MTRSLRARLLLGLVALVIGGLLVSDLATYAALQTFLTGRVDQQLREGAQPTVDYLLSARQPRGPGTPPPNLPTGTYAALIAPDGSVLNAGTFVLGDATSSARPELPGHLPKAGIDVPVIFDAKGSGGVPKYRVLVQLLDHPNGDVLVVGIPLTDVQSTLSGLLELEAIISLGVLAGMAILAWWIIRVGLRPLERMGATAQAIAAGDLSRRVEPETPSTEIGRLGLALNGMLTQIETAFQERTESEQRLRRFVADASHELRTPLTSIRGYAELLRRGAAQRPQDAIMARRRIEEEAIRMSILVDDMLLLARLDQGRPLERTRVDLSAIAHDACADARVVEPRRRIQLTTATPVAVAGDEPRIRQVLANLIRNALVHTPKRTPVEVSVGEEGGRAILTVADHGHGLPADHARRVFEPFYRADPGRSRDRGGSGLGLSIVAAVVAAHGGQVEVLITPGGGATFRVELPLAAV